MFTTDNDDVRIARALAAGKVQHAKASGAPGENTITELWRRWSAIEDEWGAIESEITAMEDPRRQRQEALLAEKEHVEASMRGCPIRSVAEAIMLFDVALCMDVCELQHLPDDRLMLTRLNAELGSLVPGGELGTIRRMAAGGHICGGLPVEDEPLLKLCERWDKALKEVAASKAAKDGDARYTELDMIQKEISSRPASTKEELAAKVRILEHEMMDELPPDIRDRLILSVIADTKRLLAGLLG